MSLNKANFLWINMAANSAKFIE